MIRRKYRIDNKTLYYLLMKSRINRMNQFDPMPSRREVEFCWKQRLHENNRFTIGSEA